MSAAEGDLGWGWESFPMCASHHLVQAQEKKKNKNMLLRPFLSDHMYLNFPLLLLEMTLESKILEDKFITQYGLEYH